MPIAGNVANWQQSSDKFGLKKEIRKQRKSREKSCAARVDSGAAKTRKELGKTGKKQETENIRFPKIRARETRDKRERDETETKRKPEPKQRKNTDKTKKEQRNAAHPLADYQPPKRTKKTPEKKENRKNRKPKKAMRKVCVK